ncbi:DUF4184 family protein [Cytophagales bacterium LB-30]|uniref:DUF4184 family protein n=1 Tax=Shiella aurantiaca TaxID=3058365 RepID=A0ABT8F5G0_9BACT|nr:DUF4184 family protein [Shiella aurantiaca]MDN4165489.1 DUF4184 family protein [Shiella aurantiaca]
MPFTFSHPAIILPLRKSRYVSVSALVIGSMSPDFEYILKLKLHATISHTFLGAFILDLPICIGLYLVFHAWVKRPLLRNSPHFISSRLGDLYALNVWEEVKKRGHILISSFLIGIFSHFLWDSFTHENTFSVNALPFLQTTVDLGIFNLPLYRVLQHVSTLLGAWAIYYCLQQMPVQSMNYKKDKAFWLVSLLAMGFILGLRGAMGFIHFGHFVASVLGACVYALMLSGLLFSIYKKN